MTSALLCLRALQCGIPLSFLGEITIGELLDIFYENSLDYDKSPKQAQEISGDDAIAMLTGGIKLGNA